MGLGALRVAVLQARDELHRCHILPQVANCVPQISLHEP